MVNSWLNNDGLYLKFGTDKTTPSVGGEFCYPNGNLHEIAFTLDLTTLSTSSASIVDDRIFFPDGVRIEEVEVVTITAAAGSTATLTIGLIGTDRSTVIDADGFVAALAQTAIDTAGEKNVIRKGSTGAGSSIGTTTTSVGYITAEAGTAVFTEGEVEVRIRYEKL